MQINGSFFFYCGVYASARKHHQMRGRIGRIGGGVLTRSLNMSDGGNDNDPWREGALRMRMRCKYVRQWNGHV